MEMSLSLKLSGKDLSTEVSWFVLCILIYFGGKFLNEEIIPDKLLKYLNASNEIIIKSSKM